jgi:hypothetical protein
MRLMISGFIKDLLDIPSHQSIETAPIQLDQVSRHVELFVDLVLSSGQALMYIALDDCKPLLALCDRLQAPAIDKRVWQALTSRLWNTTLFKNLSPWDIFRLAANRGDDYVCGKAVAAFQVHGYQYNDICSSRLSSIEIFPSDISQHYSLATTVTRSSIVVHQRTLNWDGRG